MGAEPPIAELTLPLASALFLQGWAYTASREIDEQRLHDHAAFSM